MRKGDRISSIFWLIFSLVIAIDSYGLDLGNFHAPHAGFFPFLASLILGIFSVILLISTGIKKPDTAARAEDIAFNTQTLPKLLYVIVSLFFYAILLNTFGFILITVILIGFLLGTVEPQKWYVVIGGAISISLVTYLVFDVLLKVQLPKGFLGF